MSRNNREKIAAAFRPCKFESRPKAAAPAKSERLERLSMPVMVAVAIRLDSLVRIF